MEVELPGNVRPTPLPVCTLLRPGANFSEIGGVCVRPSWRLPLGISEIEDFDLVTFLQKNF